MSDLSTSPYLNKLPSSSHDLRVGLRETSGDSGSLQHAAAEHAALFQTPPASNSTVLDIQPAVGIPADADTHAKHIISFVGGR